ncbi:MAG: hypothetical protein IKF93_06985 [Lachnospiraceae bacterium]|nr:hypothetical protein [Lachnospiraceae bacterium]
MNFKKLASVLSKKKILILRTDGNGVQWAGDDVSMYELSGMPKFTTDTLLFCFGVNMSKKDSWLMEEADFPEEFDTSPELTSDLPIVIDENMIIISGSTYALLHTADCCFILPERYTIPIMTEQTHLFLRTMPITGEAKIIAREGMFVTAIFQPVNATEEITKWLEKTANAVR